MDLNNYSAKPDKTIRQHTDDLLERLKFLYNSKLIKSIRIFNLTKIACEYHDYGKTNSEFQARIKAKTHFNPEVV